MKLLEVTKVGNIYVEDDAGNEWRFAFYDDGAVATQRKSSDGYWYASKASAAVIRFARKHAAQSNPTGKSRRSNPSSRASIEDRLRKMRVGSSFKIEPTFTVKRIRANDWFLNDSRVTERARFGTAKQMAEDVEHVQQYGTLPPPSGPRW